MRKVLLIAFSFPPHRSSGVYRPAALTKYLLREGWQATVLSAAGAPGVEDGSLLRKIPPEVRIVRTPYWHLRKWERPAANLFRLLTSRSPLTQPVAVEVSTNAHRKAPPRPLLPRLADSIQNALYFPDESVGWIPSALEKAIQLHMKDPFEVIYSTHPPRAGHVVAMVLHRLFRLPWVAEFRDPWTFPPGAEPIATLTIPALRRNRWLLRRIVRAASALVPVTEGHAEELVATWGASADKVTVVTNGFDDEDFAATSNGRPAWMDPNQVHLVHFGTIYPQFHGSFFPALKEAIRESQAVRQHLRIHIVGFPSDEVIALAERTDLKPVLQFHKFLSHAEALAAMRASDCLLLFYDHPYTARSSIPGKVYEFLRVGRPLLVFACQGGLSKLVDQGKAGWVLPAHDIPAIKRMLTAFATRTVKWPGPPSEEFISQFRYDRLAGQLASILDRVTRKER